ncbi:hypothetical protein ACVDG3_15875 [Meridianimarinicoccus sp. RP-17]|uniref:hypothetical protein n=1 Tax=Meridianimarinicoccus zhengii TaxID=2056810 RepID=UPI0013A6FC17|nr:hypothetical protein [Phycocomes zhengii]
MDRRMLIAALGGIASACLLPMRAGGAVAGAPVIRENGCLPRGDDAACRVGFSSTPPLATDPCRGRAWAMALAYMLRGYGARVDPGDLLIRAGLPPDGCPDHDTDREEALLHAMAGTWTDRAGQGFLLGLAPLPSLHEAMPRDPEFPRLLTRLARQPLLCGAAGHATVMTALTTVPGLAGTVRRDTISVRDPHAPTGGLRLLTDAELSRPFWVLGVSVVPLSTR